MVRLPSVQTVVCAGMIVLLVAQTRADPSAEARFYLGLRSDWSRSRPLTWPFVCKPPA